MKSPVEQTKRSLPTQQRLLTVYRELFRGLLWALPMPPHAKLTITRDRFEGCETILSTLETIVPNEGRPLLYHLGAVSQFRDPYQQTPHNAVL